MYRCLKLKQWGFMKQCMLEVVSIISQPLTVETDSLLVVQALKTRGRYQFEVGSILEACRDILSSGSKYQSIPC